MTDFLIGTQAGTIINIKVLPRSSRNQLVGRHGDALKIRLSAPPVDGAANKGCCDFLAGLLGVAASRVEIVAGTTSRHKRVLVSGLDPQAVMAIIAPLL